VVAYHAALQFHAVEDTQPARLMESKSRQPRDFDAQRRRGRLLGAWNLIVPEEILDRSWEETV
jgi:hypothetical protein